MNPRNAVAALVAVGLLAAGCGQGGNETDIDVTAPGTSTASDSKPSGSAQVAVDGIPNVVSTVATGLATPWGIDFLPDGRAVVTERDSARVLVITPPKAGAKVSDKDKATGKVVEVGKVPETNARGEAGLLGVAVSPSFATDGLLYFYVSTTTDNRIVRAELKGNALGETTPILTGIPAGTTHDGGRLLFGPDGYLYVSTGEGGKPERAQNRKSLAGKILRITTDGKAAPDNPFKTRVWSWGHRNVQGLAFDADGSLWASEFGQDKADELNRIVPGQNYGWPEVEGTGGPAKFAQPALVWKTDDASPSGLTYASGYLWMAGLQGERLWRIKVADGQASDPAAYFKGKIAGEYGRLRTVVQAPDGRLWLTTSNKDGRGIPGADDDRILVIEP